MKIKKVDDKPMVIHTKEKAKGYSGTCDFKSEGCEWIWIK